VIFQQIVIFTFNWSWRKIKWKWSGKYEVKVNPRFKKHNGPVDLKPNRQINHYNLRQYLFNKMLKDFLALSWAFTIWLFKIKPQFFNKQSEWRIINLDCTPQVKNNSFDLSNFLGSILEDTSSFNEKTG